MRLSPAAEDALLAQAHADRDVCLVLEDQHYSTNGTVRVTRQHRQVTLHRRLYERTFGSIPARFLLAVCGNSRCLQPYHHYPSDAPRTSYTPPRPRPAGGPTAAERARARTQCPQGHAYTPENTHLWTDRDGYEHRGCIRCRRRRAQEQRNRRKAERILA